MAGPFATSGNNAGNISGVQYSGGFQQQPTPDVAQAVAGAVGVAANVAAGVSEANKKELIKEETAAVTQQIESVKAGLLATKYPELQKQMFSEQALKDPYTKAKFEEFNLIQNAVKSGRLSSEFALQRIDQYMSDAIARRPQFKNEIVAAANAAAGANVASKVYTDLMSVSPNEKLRQEVEAEAYKNGVSVETYLNYARSKFINQAEGAQLDLAEKQGTASAREWGMNTLVKTNEAATNVIELMNQEITATGGIADPNRYTGALGQIFSTSKSNFLANIPAGTPESVVNARLSAFDNMQSTFENIIKSGDLAKVLQQKELIAQFTSKSEYRNSFPQVATAIDVFGPETGVELMSEGIRFNSLAPEEQSAAISARVQGSKGLGPIMAYWAANPTFTEVIKGNVPPKDKTEMLMTQALGAKSLASRSKSGNNAAPDTVKNTRDVNFVINGDPVRGVMALGNPAIASEVAKDKNQHAKIINFYNGNEENVNKQYNELLANSSLVPKDFELVNGKIQLTREGERKNRESLGGVNPSQLGSSTKFLKDANNLLRYGVTYSGLGVMQGEGKVTPKSFFTKVTAPIEQQAQQEEMTDREPNVINVVYDGDGNFTFEGLEE